MLATSVISSPGGGGVGCRAARVWCVDVVFVVLLWLVLFFVFFFWCVCGGWLFCGYGLCGFCGVRCAWWWRAFVVGVGSARASPGGGCSRARPAFCVPTLVRASGRAFLLRFGRVCGLRFLFGSFRGFVLVGGATVFVFARGCLWFFRGDVFGSVCSGFGLFVGETWCVVLAVTVRQRFVRRYCRRFDIGGCLERSQVGGLARFAPVVTIRCAGVLGGAFVWVDLG